jgi:hypothetical protein
MDADEILLYRRGSKMGKERLEGGMEDSSRTNKRKETNISEILIEEDCPNSEYKRNSRTRKAYKWDHNNK